MTESQLGRTHTKETKIKISLSNIGKTHSEETKLKIGQKGKGRYFSEQTRDKMGKSQKGRTHTIETKIKISLGRKGKIHSLESIKKMSKTHINRVRSKEELIKRKHSIKQYKEKYPTFAKVEDMRYEPGKEEEKVMQVHCKNSNCENSLEKGGWFTPTSSQLHERIRNVEKENGNGASYIYCSDHCKDTCSIYGKRVSQLIKEDQIKAGHIEDPWYTSQEYQTWKKHIFDLDNGKCVYCDKPADHAHHILPQKIYPNLALDPDNGISCCSECHYKYGHRDKECATGYLGKLVCERIIRIKNKIEK